MWVDAANGLRIIPFFLASLFAGLLLIIISIFVLLHITLIITSKEVR